MWTINTLMTDVPDPAPTLLAAGGIDPGSAASLGFLLLLVLVVFLIIAGIASSAENSGRYRGGSPGAGGDPGDGGGSSDGGGGGG